MFLMKGEWYIAGGHAIKILINSQLIIQKRRSGNKRGSRRIEYKKFVSIFVME